MRNEWTGFVPGVWEKEIDVRDFIQKNYTPYDGDDAFLAGPTEDTKALWQQVDVYKRQSLPYNLAPCAQRLRNSDKQRKWFLRVSSWIFPIDIAIDSFSEIHIELYSFDKFEKDSNSTITHSGILSSYFSL